MKKMDIVHYAMFSWNEADFLLAATDQGLCWANRNQEGFDIWLKKYKADSTLEKNADKLRPYWDAYKQYLTGNTKDFDVPLDLHGTPFQLAVWKVLMDIPYGETRCYSDIAEAIGKPKSVRAVGTAIGKNPVLIVVPCHRVIQKNGDLGGFSAGIPLKKALLQHEQA